MNWENQFALGKASGFAFFEAYVNSVNGQVLGWIARTPKASTYSYFFLGKPDGMNLQRGSRGTYLHAQSAVETGVTAYQTTIGLYNRDIPKLTVQIEKAKP